MDNSPALGRWDIPATSSLVVPGSGGIVWRWETAICNVSRELRRCGTGPDQTEHAAAPRASSPHALESIRLIAVQRIVGTNPASSTSWTRRGIWSRPKSICEDITGSDMQPGYISGRNPVESTVARYDRPSVIELAIDVAATGRGRSGFFPYGVNKVRMLRTRKHTHVRVRSCNVGVNVRPLANTGDPDCIVSVFTGRILPAHDGRSNVEQPNTAAPPFDRAVRRSDRAAGRD
jgi:hypothetical protein